MNSKLNWHYAGGMELSQLASCNGAHFLPISLVKQAQNKNMQDKIEMLFDLEYLF